MNQNSITGRDGYIMRKALTYAIAAIESLPFSEQEWSDKEDMKILLKEIYDVDYENETKNALEESDIIHRNFPKSSDNRSTVGKATRGAK